MKFTRKQARWGSPRFVGRKGGFYFEYLKSRYGGWYALVRKESVGYVFNSLWYGIQFETEPEIIDWIENFSIAKYPSK